LDCFLGSRTRVIEKISLGTHRIDLLQGYASHLDSILFFVFPVTHMLLLNATHTDTWVTVFNLSCSDLQKVVDRAYRSFHGNPNGRTFFTRPGTTVLGDTIV
jgi:hypothetical protein